MRTGQWLVHNLLSGSECILDDDEVAELNSANEREYDNLPQLLADFTEMGITVLEETDLINSVQRRGSPPNHEM